MILNDELRSVERGEQGEAMAKVLNTLIMYGEAFGAERMVKITGEMGHAVIGTGSLTWGPVFDLMEKLIEGGALPKQSFTTDPRGYEKGVPATAAQKALFKVIFANQNRMEKEWKRMGIKDEKAYTCTAYMDEVGNIPKKGDILGWAESSAVSYANSVIGARCNRNSGILELMSNILGYVPEFGLLTDEGRKADWIIEVKCDSLPEPQLLGSAIGFNCVEDVPYIKGLDKWLGASEVVDEVDSDGNPILDDNGNVRKTVKISQAVKDYLKDMGAASASNGSVGLYHVENITPEAVELGDSLIKSDAKTFVVDDAEIARVKASYPVTWQAEEGDPEIAFCGCPHFSVEQLRDWTERFDAGLSKHGNTKVTVPTIFCAAPDVKAEFEREYPTQAAKLKAMGVTVSGLCPLSYTSNPLTENTRIITPSNKLRYYSKARFFDEAEFVDIVTGGRTVSEISGDSPAGAGSVASGADAGAAAESEGGEA